ncbi:MAG: GNAT family N-acetyltransferase [Gammaproteobacteria bacterium]|nr:GNAT family N-acetyltransferase [Gammaproteobacteria bacterium]
MKTDNYRVRRASLADARPLVALFDAYRVFYDQESDPVAAERFLDARLMNDESVIFVAENPAGELLGFTQLYPLFTSVGMQRLWLLNDLYVAENARRAGVASALLDAAQAFGRDDGAKGLLLETHHTNSPARALYERQGWVLNEATVYYEFDCRK